MNKLKKAVDSDWKIFWFNDSFDFISKYFLTSMYDNVDSSVIKTAVMKNIIVPKQQLPELLGERGNIYDLTRLQGVCVVIADNKDLAQCTDIYNMNVFLIPDSVPEHVLKKVFFEKSDNHKLSRENP